MKIMSEEELREVKRRKEKILARVEEKRRQAEMKLRMQMLGSSGDVEENLDLSFPMPSSVTPPAESLLRPDPIGRSSVDASENLGKGYVIPPMATSQSVTQPVIPHRPPPPVYHEREPVIPHRPPPPVYHEREPVIPHRPPLSSVIPPQIQMRGIEALEGPESTGMATPHRPTRAEIDARQFAARSHSLMPSVTAQPPSVVDGITVAPGAKNAGVPGNRSRIAELLGLSDATRQRNFNQQAFDERTHGEGQRFFNQRFGTSPMPSTTTPTAVNYNKPVKLTLQESFVRIQKDADKQLKITKSLEALGLMRKGTADKAKAKYEARLDSLGEQVAVSLLKEGMSRLEVAQALQELPLSGEARDRLVKTYGVDVKKAKKETEFQQFYDAAGNPVARYIKGTPEWEDAVENTDLRTDKPGEKGPKSRIIELAERRIQLREDALGRPLTATEKLDEYDYVGTQRTLDITPLGLSPEVTEGIAADALQATSDLSEFTVLMQDINKHGGAVTGLTGEFLPPISGFLGQIPAVGKFLEQSLTGAVGDISPEDLARIRNAMNKQIGPLITVYTGENSGRYTEAERGIAERASKMKDKFSTPAQLKEIVADVIALSLMKQMRSQMLQGTLVYDLTSKQKIKDSTLTVGEGNIQILGDNLLSRGLTELQVGERLKQIINMQIELKRFIEGTN